jgi:hypothetical protein
VGAVPRPVEKRENWFWPTNGRAGSRRLRTNGKARIPHMTTLTPGVGGGNGLRGPPPHPTPRNGDDNSRDGVGGGWGGDCRLGGMGGWVGGGGGI